MTDEAKALVERVETLPDTHALPSTMALLFEMRDCIETQAREIERLRVALGEIMERGGAFGGIWCALAAQEALAEGTKP